MRTLNLFFQVHEPMPLRTYRFFDIGENHTYFDNFLSQSIYKNLAKNCYLPMNHLLLNLTKEYGKEFMFTISISGIAIDLMKKYSPEILDSFKELANTGCVEFLAETYSNSLSSINNIDEFKRQVLLHSEKIEKEFNIKPVTFKNTELIYNNDIGDEIFKMGFNTVITEGAKHVLGWKSPNYLYCSINNPKLKILLRNNHLSDDIEYRFSNKNWNEFPLTAEKYASWLNSIESNEQIVNIFVDYKTFGEYQKADSGIFDFMKILPKAIFEQTNFNISTPSKVVNNYQPISYIDFPFFTSWADEERDITAWIGNEMQNEAYNSLFKIEKDIIKSNNNALKNDWLYLQDSNYLRYLSTKWFSDGNINHFSNPFNSPYEAFINYMNIISDLSLRAEKCTKTTKKKENINTEKNDNVFDNFINLTEKEIKNLFEKIEIKELAYSILDKTEIEIKKLNNKIPDKYKSTFNNIMEELHNKKPSAQTIKKYKNKFSETVKSLFED